MSKASTLLVMLKKKDPVTVECKTMLKFAVWLQGLAAFAVIKGSKTE